MLGVARGSRSTRPWLGALGLLALLTVTATPALASAGASGAGATGVLAAGYRPEDEGYHSYREMVAHIRAVEARHADIVRVFSIGGSYEGRRIWAAEVSDRAGREEGEPEVLFDGLHHAREHLSAEMAIAVLDLLSGRYGQAGRLGRRVTRLVDARRTWIVFMVNPDGLVHDLSAADDGGEYRGWRKNRQPTPGSGTVGTDLNRNYAYRFGCCGGSSARPASQYYRGPRAFSAPETRALRDFVESRVVDGRQRIRAHISFHAAGEQVLWPYSYTRANLPPDMTALDQRTFRALGRALAATNGYRAAQSSDLYLSDGDMIDWMYARQRVFSFTFELYPRNGGVPERYYPPDEVITRETRRNRDAVLALMDAADCPYAVLGHEARQAWCGPLFDDLEIDRGWQTDPRGRDTAGDGAWSRGVPDGAGAQLGSAISGQAVLVTGRAAGHDVDRGRTTIRSPLFRVPADGTASLRLRYWVALSAAATEADGLRVHLVGPRGARLATLLEVRGDGTRHEAAWRSLEVPLPAGLGRRLLAIEVEAADVGRDALVEAGVDQVRVTAD